MAIGNSHAKSGNSTEPPTSSTPAPTTSVRTTPTPTPTPTPPTPKPTPKPTPTPAPATTAAGYYIRGVYVPAKLRTTSPSAVATSTTPTITTTLRDMRWQESTTLRPRYKPWQMRSWGGGGSATKSDVEDVKEVHQTDDNDVEDVGKSTRSQWSLIRGR